MPTFDKNSNCEDCAHYTNGFCEWWNEYKSPQYFCGDFTEEEYWYSENSSGTLEDVFEIV